MHLFPFRRLYKFYGVCRLSLPRPVRREHPCSPGPDPDRCLRDRSGSLQPLGRGAATKGRTKPADVLCPNRQCVSRTAAGQHTRTFEKGDLAARSFIEEKSPPGGLIRQSWLSSILFLSGFLHFRGLRLRFQPPVPFPTCEMGKPSRKGASLLPHLIRANVSTVRHPLHSCPHTHEMLGHPQHIGTSATRAPNLGTLRALAEITLHSGARTRRTVLNLCYRPSPARSGSRPFGLRPSRPAGFVAQNVNLFLREPQMRKTIAKSLLRS